MNVLGGAADAPRGKSGADGRFELRGVAPGDYTLRVKATGWATEAVDPVKVTRDGAVPPVDVVLAPGAAISGTVRRRTGGGVEGAFVLARVQGASAAPARPGLENPATGPDGSFVLDGLRGGATYDLQVFLGGGLGPGPAQKGILAPSDGVEIAVAGTGRIEGSAVDAKTGQPLAAFDVSYEPERGGGMVFRIARRAGVGASGAGQRLHVESEDGRFALEDVPAGRWSVVVEAKGYQVARAGGVTVEEATTTRILTTEYEEGLSPDEACSDATPQELKDRWGLVLFEFLLRGLLEHRLLHADPNLANFSFRRDGRVVVYDFGCVKEVPVKLARGYRSLCRAALDGQSAEIPGLLAKMGVHRADGRPLEEALATPWLGLVFEFLRPAPPYRFGADGTFYGRLFDAARGSIAESDDLRFPADIVFVHRTVAGHLGNLTRLRAMGPWRERLERFAGAP